jgi:hypothetical protein
MRPITPIVNMKPRGDTPDIRVAELAEQSATEPRRGHIGDAEQKSEDGELPGDRTRSDEQRRKTATPTRRGGAAV